MPIKLFADQQTTKQKIYHAWNNGAQRIILGAPTGSGKTVIAASIILDCISRGKVALFIVDRIQLCNQAAQFLKSLGLRVSVYQGENTKVQPDNQVIVASIQTLSRRRLPIAQLIIIDEVHIFHQTHEDILNTYDGLLCLGMSATPMRKGLAKYFDTLNLTPSTKELIQMGRLTPIHCYDPFTPDLTGVEDDGDDFNKMQLAQAVNRPKIIGNIVTEWLRLGKNRQTLCFAVDIAHSKAIVLRFNDIGIPAMHLDAYSDDDTRAEALALYNSGKVKILSSVGVLSIGFNSSITGCLILARPTKSKMLYIQQAGRGIRIHPGKKDAILLDFAGNISRHGLPQLFKIPKLSDAKIRRKKTVVDEQLEIIVRCRVCQTHLEPGQDICPVCNTLNKRDNTVIELKGKLSRVEERITQKEKDIFFRELISLCEKYKKKRGYAFYLYKRKYNEEPKASCYRIKNLVEPSEVTKKWFKSQLIRAAKGAKYRENTRDAASIR